MRHVVAILLGLTILGESGVALAESASNESTPKQVLYGAGGALSTVVYLPFKAGFCILGGIASAFTAIASTTTAEKVVGASCRGTWVITPDTLRGKEPMKFVGDMPAKSGGVAKP
jgi:hypothetical protein